ncbi:MAG TPA: DUF1579 family protein, partial [Patescibacteria group bacterium]|nr:DUF1579 family protein [Patescibacteria group bacterium]
MEHFQDIVATLQVDAPLSAAPGREHLSLAAFAGKWRMSGRNLGAAPADADTKIEGEASYQFFPGGFFLFGVDTARADQGAHTTLSCYGYDAETRLYR